MAGLSYLAIYSLAPQRYNWPTAPCLWHHVAILSIVGPAIGGIGTAMA